MIRTIDVDLTDTIAVETLTINDGDLLVFRVKVPITSDHAEAIVQRAHRLIDRIGKRATYVIIDSTMALDRLTAAQARDLCQRITAATT